MARIITTATPQRISFAGGGTDIDYFYEKHEGLVISSTINKFIYVTVKRHHKLFNEKYRLNYSITEQADTLEDIKNEIARECLRLLKVEESIYISTISDLPSSSGLASSSCFAVGLLNALHQFKGEHVSLGQIAEEACQIEIEILKKPIGKQDQYAATFGGINRFSFHRNGKVTIQPIINSNIIELFNSSLLFYTQIQRSADTILSDQKKEFSNTVENLKKIKAMGEEFHTCLSSKPLNLERLGELLHSNWLSKKLLSTKISNASIDKYYDLAIANGALGGKILGAGGGGFLLFIAPKSKHESIKTALFPLKYVPIKFEPVGTRILLNF